MNYDLFKLINNSSGNSFLNALMKDAAKYAIAISFLVVAVLCLLRLLRRDIWPVVWSAVGLVLTFVLGLAAAAAYKEKRPFQTHHVHQLIAHAPGQSFPSDHATAAFGLAFVALVFLSRLWGALLILVALLIGFARVYLGIHYPGDIGGSFLCAVVGVGIAWLVARLVSNRSTQRDPAGTGEAAAA
ncbi:MAG TPA: phosphatase PAP2 family protein [Mycobacteriales bacterium]|nr:phosphatase PAP2 family protein [Mycobacteriales bacterium]